MTGHTRRQVLKATAAAFATVAAAPLKADFAPVRTLPVIVGRTISSESDYKKRAIADYASNMKAFGGALSSHGKKLLRQTPRSSAPWDFDVVIIGSGYGGSICAARLAMAKRPEVRIAVLERGREWIPGTFGDTLRQNSKESRFKLLGMNRNTVDNPIGLMNVMQNDEVNVLSGNGLGGTSLINANVTIRPDRECFEQICWPAALRDRDVLEPYFNLASRELGVQTEASDASPKARAQRLAATQLAACGAHLEPADLAVTRGSSCAGGVSDAIVNRQGLVQRACIDCGDCNSGCNVGAKNTLAMNYLPLARRHGAEIYTHTEVVRLEKLDGYYRIHFKIYTEGPFGQYQFTCGTITSRLVILGAGSIGSSEILLRSRGCGMEFSERLGQQWTMNGDAVGFVRNSQHLLNSAASSAYPNERGVVGPTIQTNLTYPNRSDLTQRVLIQDGSVIRSYANILGALMLDMDFDRTMIMLGMGHDGANGRVVLRDDGHGAVKWPGLKEGSYRKLIRKEFAKVAEAHGGDYKYLKLFGDKLITVHPLGGCAMSDVPDHGVVDEQGRVFAGNAFKGQGDGMIESNVPGLVSEKVPVHQGLYVADGSIIPTSIGCNPMLTIAALSERIAERIILSSANRDLFSASTSSEFAHY